MSTLSELFGDLFSDPLGVEQNARAKNRQNGDWKIARASLTAASEAIADQDDQMAIAHALIGLLAMQMSEL